MVLAEARLELSTKKIAWLDTLRVLASLSIIFVHYFMCPGFQELTRLQSCIADVSRFGVALFFALSGWLIPASLERASSAWSFCKRKLLRVVIPFTVSWWALGTFFVLLGLLDPPIGNLSPITYLLYAEKSQYAELLAGMFPLDISVMLFFDVKFSWFVGEWFMGTILWLYIFSPLLNKCAAKAPALSLAASVVLSFAVYCAVELFVPAVESWMLFPVQLPSFMLGIVMFRCREKLLLWRRRLTTASCVVLAAALVNFALNYPPEGKMFLPLDPTCFMLLFPAVYLTFVAAEKLNEHSGALLNWFNGFNDVSYMCMLLQHQIIFLFAMNIEFGRLHSFGRLFVFFLITLTTVLLSAQFKKFSDAVERRLRG